MNKKTHYVKRKNKANIDALALFFMLHDSGGGCCFTTDAAMRAAWMVNRDEILALWTQRHPSTRPRLFWRYEHPASYERLLALEQARIDASDFKARRATCPNPIDEKAELERIGELDDDEKEARFVMPNLKDFAKCFEG